MQPLPHLHEEPQQLEDPDLDEELVLVDEEVFPHIVS